MTVIVFARQRNFLQIAPELTGRLLQAPCLLRSNFRIDRFVRMLRTGFSMKKRRNFDDAARERNFIQNVQDAPRMSAIFFQIFRMLRTGARFSLKFQDAPHGSALFFRMFRMLRTGARFLMNKPRNCGPHAALSSSKFSQDGPHGLPNVHMLRTGARFSQKFQDALQGSAISDEETTKF